VDIITACDLRLSTADATFCVKEVDLGIVADIGTLQRLPFAVGEQRARELALTARDVCGDEAAEMGLTLGPASADRDALRARARELAECIAAKSPLTTRGTKRSLNYSREHPTEDGLNHVAMLNAAQIMSTDLDEAIAAMMEKRKAEFPGR